MQKELKAEKFMMLHLSLILGTNLWLVILRDQWFSVYAYTFSFSLVNFSDIYL